MLWGQGLESGKMVGWREAGFGKQRGPLLLDPVHTQVQVVVGPEIVHLYLEVLFSVIYDMKS